nr:uncharacterized protein LOC124497084 [Dermatophagoides farinae]
MNKWRNVKPLRIQQSITLEDRLKIIRILYKADIIVFYIHILFFPLCFAIGHDYYHYNVNSFGKEFNFHIFILIDAILYTNMAYSAIQCGIFFTLLGSINSASQSNIVERLNLKLSKISINCQRINKQFMHHLQIISIVSIKLRQHLNMIHYEHGLACNVYIYLYNQLLWANVLLGFILISIPFNIICVSALLVKDLIWLQVLMTYTAITIHSILILGLLFRLAKQNVILHKAKYYLIPIIQAINCIKFQNDQRIIKSNKTTTTTTTIDLNTFRLKLKIEQQYQRLTWGPKYGPFVAIMGTVTYAFIFNLALTYVAIFIFILTHFV